MLFNKKYPPLKMPATGYNPALPGRPVTRGS